MSDAPRELLFVTAALLDQGRTVDRLSCALTAAAFAVMAILPALAPNLQWTHFGFAAAAVLAGLVQTYFAIRTGLDAALFRRTARTEDFAAIDGALAALGLVPAGKLGRPSAARIAGARALLRWQILALAVQILCVLIAAVVALTNR